MTQNVKRIPVQDVQPSAKRKPACSHTAVKEAWSRFGPVEAAAPVPESAGCVSHLFTEHNLLAKAVHDAFYEHHPLRLSPDAIWITIAQGFALHINQNPELHREKFVSHQGKEVITIDMTSSTRDALPWEQTFPMFAEQISKRTKGDIMPLLECTFSTSTQTDRIVSQIILMDTVQSYFEFEICCGCGIPYVDLLGTADDWREVRDRAGRLISMVDDLHWWGEELLPVLDEFLNAAQGSPNNDFWKSICNLHGASGTRRPINGWIQVFFPYLLKSNIRGSYDGGQYGPGMEKNKYLGQWRLSVQSDSTGDLGSGIECGMGCGQGVELDIIPGGISKVPFKLVNMAPGGGDVKMLLLGGLSTIFQTAENGALQPLPGWAVVKDHAE